MTQRLRRSIRLNIHDSNGRDFLGDSIGSSRQELEEWITSATVRPHLQLWYQVCVAGPKRFNDAVEWINSGEHGYFYNPKDLEEDLLLMCLGEGEEGDGDYDTIVPADGPTNTSDWITQELWARTAWRVVQANRGKGQAFEKHAVNHPAGCYGFVIDLLCLAFHSLAFRGQASVYASLINGGSGPLSRHRSDIPIPDEAKEDVSSTISDVDSDSEASSDISAQDSKEVDILTPMTSDQDCFEDTARDRIGDDDLQDPIQSNAEDEDDMYPRKGEEAVLRQARLEPESMMLRLIDETGTPITGYRRAA